MVRRPFSFGSSIIEKPTVKLPDCRPPVSHEINHEAPLTAGSMLARITGKQILGIDGMHHQGNLRRMKPLVAATRAQDGTVRAMKCRTEPAGRPPFLLSMQLHPEPLAHNRAALRARLSRFVQICRPKPIQ